MSWGCENDTGVPPDTGGASPTSIPAENMNRIFRPSCGLADWRAGLADPDKHWRAGFSAMATAQSWEAASGALPPEIARLLGDAPELLFAIPEHKVPLPGGQRDSQCDVFALVREGSRTISVAVEAKVAEPFGDTVGVWFKDTSRGKRDRLSALCDWLGLPFPPSKTLRYQLIHRTAAAIVEAHRFGLTDAAMIVQSFSPKAQWLGDFEDFAAALGTKAGLDRAGSTVLPNGMTLTLGWAQGDARFLTDLAHGASIPGKASPWSG